MRVFEFTNAILRMPGRSVVNGLRDDTSQTPRYDVVRAEHAAYADALRAIGIAVDVLPALEDFPDSMFVEDPALTFANGAILLRPGAPSRLGERETIQGALQKHFTNILSIDAPDEFVDGGDILVTPKTVFIGLSKRTNRKGADALARRLAELGHTSRIEQTPPGILHFKTASSLMSEEAILATKPLAASGVFDGFDVILTPEGEEAAANALRMNDTVFVGSHYPRTIDLLAKRGFDVRPLAVSEVAKLDAGLSCMSLRW
ncbi:MAG TPA: arginine deiminase family protein [Rhizomicrobium sp.]|nr:arginine deiminase family protein [Rhizomicrobium sp.]